MIRKIDSRTVFAKAADPEIISDPEFNHRAAQAAYELVMKMDRDEAEMLTTMIVSELIEKDIEDNLPAVQRHLDEVIAKRHEHVKRAVLKAAMATGDPTAEQVYKALSETPGGPANVVSKVKIPQDYGYVWRESDFRRDPRTGQFQTKVVHNQRKPLSSKTATAMGIKPPKTKLNPKQQAQYQDEYMQVANFLRAVNASAPPGDTEVLYQFRDKSGQRWVERGNGTKVPKESLAEKDTTLEGIMARPTGLTAGGAAFGLSTALGGQMQPQSVEAINRGERGFGDFTQSWLDVPDDQNRNEKTFQRIAAGSQYVGQVAPAGSKVQLAAKFGEIVGSHGPQAEAVIGPTARKSAYRYRGTEKAPERELVRAYEVAINTARTRDEFEPLQQMKVKAAQTRAVNQALRAKATKENKPVEAVKLTETERKNILNSVSSGMARDKASTSVPTWEERAPGREAITDYLSKNKLPNRSLYALQLASGNTPPSEGVMLNKDGQIISQSVGYGDDHYLPFNLKNLNGLKGGEYIRTRSVGGLTAEDVYTGLVSGARRVTVVSRSGTFSMEFEQDFRGGRRYNDKAGRMVRRYEQLLDAVQSEQVQHKAIPEPIREAIVGQVEQEYGFEPLSVKQKMIAERVSEYRSNPEMTQEDHDLINFIWVARRQDHGPDADTFLKQIQQEVKSGKDYVWKLDGKGYDAAAKALAEQFPYYLKSDATVIDEKDLVNTERDKGYVEPGRNRPTAAMAGLHGTSINPGKKFSASQADYQGARKAPMARGTTRPTQAPEMAESAASEPKQSTADAKISQIKQESAFRKAAHELNRALANDVDPEGMPKWVGDQFESQLRKPKGPEEIETWVHANRDVLMSKDSPESVKRAVEAFELAVNVAGNASYDPELAFTWTRHPQGFGGKPYAADADEPTRQLAVRQINQRRKSLTQGRNLSDLSDDEFRDELEAISEVHRIVTDHPEVLAETIDGAKLRKHLLGQYDGEQVKKLLSGKPTELPKRLEAHAEDVQRMRTLVSHYSDSERQRVTARVIPVREVGGEKNLIDSAFAERELASKKKMVKEAADKARQLDAKENLTQDQDDYVQEALALESNVDDMGAEEIQIALNELVRYRVE